jgi:hypothetical protein
MFDVALIHSVLLSGTLYLDAFRKSIFDSENP